MCLKKVLRNGMTKDSDVFAFDDAVRVNTLELKKLMNFFRSRKFSVIWSFALLRERKSTNIPFISEDGLAIEWNSKNLTELLKRESGEFVLNHKGGKSDSKVISLKGDLTIKVQNETRDNWLINFIDTIKTNIKKATIDMIRGVVKLINNSTLMNTSIFDGFIEVSNRMRDTGCLGDFGNEGTGNRGVTNGCSRHDCHLNKITSE
nr:hypothetical protein [Tanacetum cinerariifolium]